MGKSSTVRWGMLLLPSIIIAIISILAFADGKVGNAFISSLLFLFPVLFFVQGIMAKLLDSKLSLLIISVVFLAIVFIFMNVSALIYLAVYWITALAGYWMMVLFSKLSK
ncbi:MAG: hypothetical protein ACI4XL_04995 [Bacillus sp. (in: firmicutes)]